MSVYAPIRLLIAAAAALLIAAAIGSSSAHAMLLGDAVLRSVPGAPLRAVIPVKPSPGEQVEAGCFRLVAPAGSGPMVTAKVSLERAAATPRLVVTTTDAVTDPLVRFAIESGCNAPVRRNYAVMLDPRGATAAARSASAVRPVEAAEPGRERRESSRDATGVAVPVDAAAFKTASGGAARSPAATSATPVHRSTSSLAARAAAMVDDDSETLLWYLGAPLAMGVVALGIVLFTRRASEPPLPDWTRGGAYDGPRSFTDMSAQPVALSSTDFDAMPSFSTRQRPDGASLRVVKPGIAANTLRRSSSSDVAALTTLLNVSEDDFKEDRAVREAWAAARKAVEADQDNEILKAIDAAERELLFVPPPAEASMDRSLEEDLAARAKPAKKAAA